MNGKRILAINGSYREGGMTDQAVERVLADLRALGARAEHIRLRDYPIGFCRNCRECMQQPGSQPGHCVLDDGMAALVGKIEQADAYVLAAPTNFYAVTAIFKRFMERLAVYGYWPWGEHAPKMRKAGAAKKPAILISSCAAPGFLGRIAYSTNRSLRATATTLGAQVVGSMVTGLASQQSHPQLPDRARRRADALAPRLAA